MNLSFLCTTPPHPHLPRHSSTTTWFHRVPKPPHSVNPAAILRISSSQSASKTPAARDRVIDFGKYKGKMLGTLPSTYLKWVSKNLRARDFEEWANLADEVLDDPVYRDRIEWEFAQKLLNGDVPTSLVSANQQTSAVSELLEISQRFGWDNEDKVGWNKIDFGLLGTSRGGRIPRIRNSSEDLGSRRREVIGKDMGADEAGPDKGLALMGDCEGGDGKRRKERRERLRSKRSSTEANSCNSSSRSAAGSNLRSKLLTELQTARFSNSSIDQKSQRSSSMSNFGKGDDSRDHEEEINQVEDDGGEMKEIGNPFPGRQSLLRKVLNRRRLKS